MATPKKINNIVTSGDYIYNKQSQEIVHKVIMEMLDAGEDMALIDGTNKPNLLQPGADKIINLLNLTFEAETETYYAEDNFGGTQELPYLEIKATGKIYRNVINPETKEAVKVLIHQYDAIINSMEKNIKNQLVDSKKKTIKAHPLSLKHTMTLIVQKRAKVYAVRSMSAISSLFTQDFEKEPDKYKMKGGVLSKMKRFAYYTKLQAHYRKLYNITGWKELKEKEKADIKAKANIYLSKVKDNFMNDEMLTEKEANKVLDKAIKLMEKEANNESN